jgi:hypothetical protein
MSAIITMTPTNPTTINNNILLLIPPFAGATTGAAAGAAAGAAVETDIETPDESAGASFTLIADPQPLSIKNEITNTFRKKNLLSMKYYSLFPVSLLGIPKSTCYVFNIYYFIIKTCWVHPTTGECFSPPFGGDAVFI